MKQEKIAKCLVIGSTNHSGVDCVSWTTPPQDFPNIIDYDVCMVVVPTLTPALLSIPTRLFDELRGKLARLFDAGGLLVVLADELRQKQGPDRISRSNWGWSPHSQTITNERGTSITIADANPFKNYLAKLKNSNFHISNFSPNGSVQQTRYIEPSTVLAHNKEGRVLAGFYTVPGNKLKQVVVLPTLDTVEPRECVQLVLDELGFTAGSPEPEWARAIQVPGVAQLESEIIAGRQQITTLEEKNRDLQTRIEAVNMYKKLLYASGKELETIFQKCLESLGATVLEEKFGDEEFTAHFVGSDHVVECKGVTKSASLEHLRQTIDHQLTYEQATGKSCHGILFVNAWRDLNPAQRVGDHLHFPQNLIPKAEANNIALIASTDFFQAYSNFLKDRTIGSSLLEKIASSNGIVRF